VAERFVLDASAGVEILSRSLAGRRLAKAIEDAGSDVWTVEHFHVEVAKVLRRDVLAGDLDDTEATKRIRTLADWELNVARVAPLLVEAWRRRHNITIHDALYVELAHKLDATLVTGDVRLAKTPRLGVRTRTGAT
jgi:predicted nucleic acid-binding protein